MPRKMSVAAAGDWSATARRDRRDAFAQQKSFSYEAAASVGRRLPPTPAELARARRGGDGRAAAPVDRRRRMLMEAKKSYSLDDQIAAGHLLDPSPPRTDAAGARPHAGRDAGRCGGGRESSVSGERSPSGGAHHRKLLMLHTMRALQHDNYDAPSEQTPPPPPPAPETHAPAPVPADPTSAAAAAAAVKAAALTSMVVHAVPPKVAEPPPRVPPPTRRVDRLPIARIWSRLRFDRRAVAASGKK